jgi:hypothetical protein
LSLVFVCLCRVGMEDKRRDAEVVRHDSAFRRLTMF